jgi:hypothetical protein
MCDIVADNKDVKVNSLIDFAYLLTELKSNARVMQLSHVK